MGEGSRVPEPIRLFVRLPLYLWLLVPAVAGGGIGITVAHHAAAPTVREAAPPVVAVRTTAAAGAPARLYHQARGHADLAAWSPGLHPLSSDAGVPTTVAAAAAAPAEQGTVVTFNAEPRTFAEAAGTPTVGGGATTAPTVTATAPPVPTTPIQISDVHTTSLTPTEATIEWQTSEPVSSQISYGLDSATLWTPADAGSTTHVAVLAGLLDGTSYRLWVDAHAADGRTASSAFVLTTPPRTARALASVANGAFELDGQPTFPTLVWGACSDQFAPLLASGIDTFLGKGCTDGTHEVAALGIHGSFVGDALDPATPGAAGSFLPDEWDTFLPNDLSSGDVQRMIPSNGGGPRFLTLTNHFFSGAAPLPQGRGMYPALIANADVVGFDLYPLQNWCRWDDFGVVFDAQRELVQLAAGKPTFQWIEARHMDCGDASLDPTPQTVRAETWLAVAGGAHAIGYFPKDFSADIGAEIASDKRALQTLTPALMEPAIDATASNGDVRVGARDHNGAVYVIAVNASRASATATITVPALGNRSLVSLDGTRSVTAANGAFTDTFGPLDVHIYIAAP
jgi:hypothetical protein